jgi:hypothetical protein
MLRIALILLLTTFAQSQEKSPMTQHAAGPFDVKIAPQQPDNDIEKAANLSRMTIDKQFHGDLEATSKGEMLATQAEAKGSGGYVALERVTGTLKGKKGGFVLQHSSTMKGGVPNQSIFVVPDSGTGELAGISGKMEIIIAPGGKHSYAFDYTFE